MGGSVSASCAPQQAATSPPPAALDQGSTDGTVSFTGGAFALGVGFQWGSGTLSFRGEQYPFSVRGMSVVDVGATRVSATGTVRNLRNLSDFSGNYVALSAGATVAGGAGVSTLRNQYGVTIEGVYHLTGVSPDARSGRGINITLSEPIESMVSWYGSCRPTSVRLVLRWFLSGAGQPMRRQGERTIIRNLRPSELA